MDWFGEPKNEPGYPTSVKRKGITKPYTDKKNYKLHAQQSSEKAQEGAGQRAAVASKACSRGGSR
jgi:hypothetical protein